MFTYMLSASLFISSLFIAPPEGSNTQPVNLDFGQMSATCLPVGWRAIPGQSNHHLMAVENGSGYQGSNALHIKTSGAVSNGTGGLVQLFSAKEYRNQRIRLTGYIKTKDVKKDAAMYIAFMKGKKLAANDELNRKQVTGNNEWTKYEMVLDVPMDATYIALGGSLTNKGEAWFSNFSLQTVDASVPATNKR